MRLPDTPTGEFIPGDPGTGRPGSILSSAFMNSLLRELVNVIRTAGIVPDALDDFQLLKALEVLYTTWGKNTFAQDAGSVNSYQVGYSPTVKQVVDGMVLHFRANTTNTGTSTFSPNGLLARQIVGRGGVQVQAGEIIAGGLCSVMYSAANATWLLLTASQGSLQIAPATSAAHAVQRAQVAVLVSADNLPDRDVGPVLVREYGETWLWTSTSHFSGYRSMKCGAIEFGHTVTPLPWQVDAVGGWVPKSQYERLRAFASENGLMVPTASWVPGAFVFSEEASGLRLPDLRDKFLRFTGTNADGGVRYLASSQGDALQRLYGAIEKVQIAAGGGVTSGVLSLSPWTEYGQYITSAELGQRIANIGFNADAVARTSAETRPTNVALHPRIHV